MKRAISLFFILGVALTGNLALGDDDDNQQVPAGAVAFHFIARITFAPPPTELVGYIPFIEGVPGPFFAATNANGDPTPPGGVYCLFHTQSKVRFSSYFLQPGLGCSGSSPGARSHF